MSWANDKEHLFFRLSTCHSPLATPSKFTPKQLDELEQLLYILLIGNGSILLRITKTIRNFMASVTIRDVAKYADVGVATVSRVINASPQVRETTRHKVEAAIETLGFTPNQAARRLSGGKTRTIGIVVPFFTNPSVIRRVQGIVSVLHNLDYDLVLFDVESATKRHQFLEKIPRRKLLDGLLIISLNPSDTVVEELAIANLPTVLVDAHHSHLSKVVVDNVLGGYQATRHLIELGHCKIGYISDYLESPFNRPVMDRYHGYRQALESFNIPFNPAYHQQGVHSQAEAKRMAYQLLTMADPPTAIFAYSDTQAIGAMETAKALNISVPDQLSIIGFDNIEISEYLNLTTIRQALFDSGVKGCQLLLENMAHPFEQPKQILLPVELIVRGTTAPPNKNAQ